MLVDKIFIYSFIHSFTDIQFGVFLLREALALYKYSDVVYAMTRYLSYRPAHCMPRHYAESARPVERIELVYEKATIRVVFRQYAGF